MAIVAFAGGLCSLRADEVTRQVQEELRRRHLYYNEIDGRASQALTLAVQRYQERQGFAATGAVDDQTLRSLGVVKEPAAPAEGDEPALPDEPVLRSDASIPEGLHPQGAVKATNPGPITKREADDFVRRYLAACASANGQDEISLYAEHLDYFDHGVVDRQYVQNEVVSYDQRWPTRKYTLISPVRISRSHGTPAAKFRVAFEVSNIVGLVHRKAAGRTDDTLGLSRRADGSLEVVSVREQRVRRSSRRRGSVPPVLRSIGRAFHSIFH